MVLGAWQVAHHCLALGLEALSRPLGPDLELSSIPADVAARGNFSGNMKNNDFGMGPNSPGAFHRAFLPFGIRVKRESEHTFEPHGTENGCLVGCLRPWSLQDTLGPVSDL